MIYKGTFRIYWGAEGEHEAFLGPGDLITVPVHCFRGFEVVGVESGFMFVVLGGDDCGGGIIVHPSILSEGQKYGLYLKKDNTLADTVIGDPIPEESELFTPLTPEEVAEYDNFTVEEMMEHVSLKKDRTARESPFTESGTFNCYHISGHPDHPDAFEVQSRDGLCVYGYEIPEGGYVPMHRRVENQILVNFSGDVKLTFDDPELMPIILGPGDTYDLPKTLGVAIEGIRETGYIYCMVHG
ncbi:MAG: cupin domain-containing protein, partial [Spirochaetia bacterium]|nr:cupin domain-containing protein [Spirochaetia bacterium]